ncbi:mannose-6-phosphate isomerase, class I [Spongiactinospora sp. TRM90649]|uniref:mannose-6-phosphate isomerase, class I n=1 Tax=Spongiactinospora sp. TRM90649 TaxID=3031114 RepID=UPI0023F7B520|nr:mannose-6-phosphate isomerase, class I [Spongiactinospora sp. TRM90649]MDF5752277.1 mannose-6-phosphate isomerase, class I [Spongiactinospora sp. TRM90649]
MTHVLPSVLPMANPIRPYAWGSRAAIAALQGRAPSPGPEAELWMGAHPGAPSLLRTSSGDVPMGDLLAAEPLEALGDAAVGAFGPRLPYLLKVLAAETPLSLQVHPTPAQAREGYAAEDLAGIPVDAPHRNYRDPYAKPELLCALEPFEALCGFRDPAASAALLAELGVAALDPFVAALRAGEIHSVVSGLLTLPPGRREPVVNAVAAACAADDELAWASDLAGHYPGDPGVVIALLMHRLRLAPGEALYVPAGEPHSYLRGVGVEIMSASDNVLRGGLTGKHIDIPELLRILSPAAGDPVVVRPVRHGDEEVYETPAREFRLSRVQVDGEAVLPAFGPSVLLGISGKITVYDNLLSTRGESRQNGTRPGPSGLGLAQGASVFVTAASGPIRLSGRGTVFRASVPS